MQSQSQWQQWYNSNAGVSLLELSIVVLLLGLLTTIIGGVLNIAFRDNLSEKSQQQLQELDQAIQRFVLTNGRLPCPANLQLHVTDPSFGIEVCASLDSTKQLVGMVPVRTLGLSNAKAFSLTDNHLIQYAVTAIQTYVYPPQIAAQTAIQLRSTGNQWLATDLAYVLLASRSVRPLALQYQDAQPEHTITMFTHTIQVASDRVQELGMLGRDLQTLQQLRQRVNFSYCAADTVEMPLAEGNSFATVWPLTGKGNVVYYAPPVPNRYTNYVPCWQRYCTQFGSWDRPRLCFDRSVLPPVLPYTFHYDVSSPHRLRELNCAILSSNSAIGSAGSIVCSHASGAVMVSETRKQQLRNFYRIAAGQQLSLQGTLELSRTTLLVLAVNDDTAATLDYQGTLQIDDHMGDKLLLQGTTLSFPSCLDPAVPDAPIQLPVRATGTVILVIRDNQVMLLQGEERFTWNLQCADHRVLWQPYRQLSFTGISNYSKLYEVLVYAEALNDLELEDVLNYLRAKY